MPKSATIIILVIGLFGILPATTSAAPEDNHFFESKVRPLLLERCAKCHGENKQQGGLRLDSKALAFQGGDSGPPIVPKDPEASMLVVAVEYRGLQMPPDARLPASETAILREWVERGAPWPGDEGALPPRKTALVVSEQDREHWSFRPRKKVDPPRIASHLPAEAASVRNARSHNPIDDFVRDRLASEGLSPAAEADRRTLIRRLTLDLTGLPPTMDEVERFVNDTSPIAYESLVETLLARPQYGERWARYWLDVVRFSQTNGYERDDEKPFAWRYRDYVIQSANQDKPFDRFVLEQLAGDELYPESGDAISGTGFYRIGVWDDEPDDQLQSVADEMDDIVSTVGTSFLGLTLGCARCHDHKFDPIGQEDYYGVVALLANVRSYGRRRSETHLVTNREAILRQLPDECGETLAVSEMGSTPPSATRILIRGNVHSPGKEVAPKFLEVLCASRDVAFPVLPESLENSATQSIPQDSLSRRATLAKWIASPDHPLTPRVIVNRLWRQHFGAGIVDSPSDFGRTGDKPSHPELLDWLANELVRSGFSLKHIQRLMVTSATYRQTSTRDEARAEQVDPANRLLWRQNLRRLEAEAIRDAILQASGTLNNHMCGRGVFPTLPAEVLAGQSVPGKGWGKSTQAEQSRRSIYLFSKRTLGIPFLEVFDAPNAEAPAAKRNVTTIAPQALTLMHGDFVIEWSRLFAEDLVQGRAFEPKVAIREAFRRALSRDASLNEEDLLLQLFHAELGASNDDSETNRLRALASVCRTIFNMNEFVYFD